MYLATKIKLKKHPTMAEKEFFFPLSLGQKPGFSYFILHVKCRHDEARKLSEHSISIGGRSLILDKNLYF